MSSDSSEESSWGKAGPVSGLCTLKPWVISLSQLVGSCEYSSLHARMSVKKRETELQSYVLGGFQE